MNLDSIGLPLDKVKYTSKLYYSKYPYKIQISIDQTKLEIYKKHSRGYRRKLFDHSNFSQLLLSLRLEIIDMLADRPEDFVIRGETYMSVFTDKEDIIRSLVDRYQDRVIGLEKPMNNQHFDIMNRHKKIIVRSRLFEKYYRFKVYFKCTYEMRNKRFQPVKEFLESIDPNCYKLNTSLNDFIHNSVRDRNIGWTIAIYLRDAEDLMMFQMRFNDDIEKIEEVVMLSSLK